MNNISEFIASGILELYLSGMATAEEKALIEEFSLVHPEIKEEIKKISGVLSDYAQQKAIEPSPSVKAFLMAAIDYGERLKNGEPVSFPPVLTENAAITDYQQWLNDYNAPAILPDLYAKIIGHTPQIITAIVWIKKMAPQEVHHNEIERFLIVEGSCDIYIEGEVHQLTAGNMLGIPLHKAHSLKVTSAIPCKVILQRIAA
jgi:mannose-6-phosphate isomerase-like protein (cupin superfamily)